VFNIFPNKGFGSYFCWKRISKRRKNNRGRRRSSRGRRRA
jgi:hypothetical protein